MAVTFLLQKTSQATVLELELRNLAYVFAICVNVCCVLFCFFQGTEELYCVYENLFPNKMALLFKALVY